MIKYGYNHPGSPDLCLRFCNYRNSVICGVKNLLRCRLSCLTMDLHRGGFVYICIFFCHFLKGFLWCQCVYLSFYTFLKSVPSLSGSYQATCPQRWGGEPTFLPSLARHLIPLLRDKHLSPHLVPQEGCRGSEVLNGMSPGHVKNMGVARLLPSLSWLPRLNCGITVLLKL